MKCFFDTNVLLYQHDASVPHKQRVADALVKETLARDDFVISTQVMMEFYHVATRKYARQISPAHLHQWMLEMAAGQPVLLTPDLIVGAMAIHRSDSISWWDSTVIAAALHAEAEVLYSEDLQHGRDFDGLQILDPFRTAMRVNEPRSPYRARRRR